MMTREEAIEELERLLSHWDDLENGKRSFRWYSKDADGRGRGDGGEEDGGAT